MKFNILRILFLSFLCGIVIYNCNTSVFAVDAGVNPTKTRVRSLVDSMLQLKGNGSNFGAKTAVNDPKANSSQQNIQDQVNQLQSSLGDLQKNLNHHFSQNQNSKNASSDSSDKKNSTTQNNSHSKSKNASKNGKKSKIHKKHRKNSKMIGIHTVKNIDTAYLRTNSYLSRAKTSKYKIQSAKNSLPVNYTYKIKSYADTTKQASNEADKSKSITSANSVSNQKHTIKNGYFSDKKDCKNGCSN